MQKLEEGEMTTTANARFLRNFNAERQYLLENGTTEEIKSAALEGRKLSEEHNPNIVSFSLYRGDDLVSVGAYL